MVQPPSLQNPQHCWKHNTLISFKPITSVPAVVTLLFKTSIYLWELEGKKTEINLLSQIKSYECREIKSAILNRVEKKQSGLLPSGYPFGGLIKLQLAWGTHGLYWENNDVETKKLLGEKLCNLVLSEIYISRIRE